MCEEDLEAEPARYARELAVLRRKRDGGFGDISALTSVPNPNEAGNATSDSSDFDDDDLDDDDDFDEVEEAADAAHERTFRDVGHGNSAGSDVRVVLNDTSIMGMDIDEETSGNGIRVGVEIAKDIDKDSGTHMHPVVQRPAPSPLHVMTTTVEPGDDFTLSPPGLSPGQASIPFPR